MPATQPKGVVLSGKVSHDPKAFVMDDDNSCVVTNAEMLKGLENLYVTVRCRIDPEKRAVSPVGVSARHRPRQPSA